jgi:hypothetical protein
MVANVGLLGVQGAVIKFTENLATEARRSGIQAFGVHPGLTPIGPPERALTDAGRLGRGPDTRVSPAGTDDRPRRRTCTGGKAPMFMRAAGRLILPRVDPPRMGSGAHIRREGGWRVRHRLRAGGCGRQGLVVQGRDVVRNRAAITVAGGAGAFRAGGVGNGAHLADVARDQR